MNPFIIRGYEGKQFFCDRKEESGRIIGALRNKRDITLISLRKMGKTGLIYHVFDLIRKEKQFETIYLDIYHTENLNQLIDQLATALYRMKRPFAVRMKDFLSNFRYVRPVITVDPMTGAPAVSVQIGNEQEAAKTLEDLFSMISERSKERKVILAIDEFQQISQYPETNTEALIRGIAQSLKNVRFIYSGSNKTLLTRMFGDSTRPFYQSTEIVFLGEIEEQAYLEFIMKMFQNSGGTILPEDAREILRLTRRHTWHTQYLCNRLFEKMDRKEKTTVSDVFYTILLENESFYFEIRNLLTRAQWNLLKAIAASDGASALMSGDFIRTFNLTNASTVRRGIESLLEKELIYLKDDLYFVYDVFFARWLENQK